MKEDVTGKAKGGYARAEKLSPAQRQEIAQNAANERWGINHSKPLKATHAGQFKIGEIVIDCAVLEDGRRVVTQRGMLEAIGLSRVSGGIRSKEGAHQMPRFLASTKLTPFISNELRRASTPILFIPSHGGRTAYGFMAETLPKVCHVYIDAQEAKKLNANQQNIADRCRILARGFETIGIIALVDEATGYQGVRPQDALEKYLELIVRKELAAWAKKFPDEFYENIYKLKGWPWPGMKKNRYSVVAHYTRDLVYERLAPDLLKELEKVNPKKEGGQRASKFHQWLSEDVGHPLLAQHLHSLIMFQRLAISNRHGWIRFMKMVDQVLPKRGTNLELFNLDPIEL